MERDLAGQVTHQLDGPAVGLAEVLLGQRDPEHLTAAASPRAVELMGDLAREIPLNLDDAGLADALARLERAERTVSADRRSILDVHDALQEELKRRYREDPTLALHR